MRHALLVPIRKLPLWCLAAPPSPRKRGDNRVGKNLPKWVAKGPIIFPSPPIGQGNEGQHRAHEEDGVLNARRHEEVGYHVHEDHHRRKLPAPGIDPVPLDPGSPQDDVGGKGHEKLEQADEDDVFVISSRSRYTPVIRRMERITAPAAMGILSGKPSGKWISSRPAAIYAR